MKDKRRQRLIASAFLLTACVAAFHPSSLNAEPVAGIVELAWSEISFDDLVPSNLDVEMYQSWNAMGMDDQGRIYIGFTSFRDGRTREDFVVFRYNPTTGERAFLGTFLDAAAGEGNLQSGENMPKGHTRMIFADGKLYMGSQGFHDFKQEIDELPNYRGAHIFAFDTSNDSWKDLAADLPNGVVIEQQGIVALNILRSEGLLIGLAHPHSDLVLMEYKTNRIRRVVLGIPWKLGNPLSREIIVAPSGNIYTYRGTEDPRQRDETHSVWVYNIHTNELKETGFTMTNGFWEAQTETKDGSKIYIATTNGQLYEFDVPTETFKDLGHMLPKEDYEAGRRIRYQSALILSPDERKIYFVPTAIDNPKGSGELYEYDIHTGEVTFVQQLPAGAYTSGDLRDDENIYFAHFGNEKKRWEGDVRLMALTVPTE